MSGQACVTGRLVVLAEIVAAGGPDRALDCGREGGSNKQDNCSRVGRKAFGTADFYDPARAVSLEASSAWERARSADVVRSMRQCVATAMPLRVTIISPPARKIWFAGQSGLVERILPEPIKKLRPVAAANA